MCRTCGCEQNGARAFFKIRDFANHTAEEIERHLLGLPHVYHVHIHQHDGQASIDYQGEKMSQAELEAVFSQLGIQAEKVERPPFLTRILRLGW